MARELLLFCLSIVEPVDPDRSFAGRWGAVRRCVVSWMWRSFGVRDGCAVSVFCEKGLYLIGPGFSRNFPPGKRAPTESAVLRAIKNRAEGVYFLRFRDGWGAPEAIAAAGPSGGMGFVFASGGSASGEAALAGNASAGRLTVALGGPRGYWPYAEREVLSFMGSRRKTAAVSLGR